MAPRRPITILLVALTLWTLVVRLYGVDFGVPMMKEADTFIVEHVRMLREGEVRFDRALSALQYPSLLAYLAAPLSDRTLDPTGAERALHEHLSSAAALWLQVRLIVALSSVLIVPGVFFLARRFVSDGWALFAAALMSTSLLHVFFAQEARCHALTASLTTWSMVAILWLRREPSWRSYSAAAVLIALAGGSFHSGMAVLAPLAVAQLLRSDKRWFDPRILLPLALTAASVRVFYWYYFDDAAKAAKGGDDATVEAFRNQMFDGSGFERLARTAWYYEPALTVLVLIALAVLVATRGRRAVGAKPVDGRDALVMLSYATPYLLLTGFFSETYERFLLPMVPLFAVFAAWGLASLAARASSRTPERFVAALACAALVVPAAASTKLSWMRGSPTTLDDAANWIRANVRTPSEQSVYLLPPLDVPLMRTLESLRYPQGRAPFFTPWSKYQNRLEEGARVEPLYRLYWLAPKEGHMQLDTSEQIEAYLDSHGPGYFLSYGIAPNQSPERSRLVDVMRATSKRLARISPDSDPDYTDHQLWDQDVEAPGWRHVTWRVLQARAVGPVIEVFERP